MGLLRRSSIVVLSGVLAATSGGAVAGAQAAPRTVTAATAGSSTAEGPEPVVWQAPPTVNRTPVGGTPTGSWSYEDPTGPDAGEGPGLAPPQDDSLVEDEMPVGIPLVPADGPPAVAPVDPIVPGPGMPVEPQLTQQPTSKTGTGTSTGNSTGAAKGSIKPGAGGTGGGASTMSVAATTAGQDLTGNANPDIVARDSAGKLWTYPGTSSGGFGTRILASSSGWNDLDQAHIVGNWNGVGGNDLIARKPATGQLYLYPGNNNGTVGTPSVIGTSWGGHRELAPAGDLSGDGKPDLIALHATNGNVVLYRGNGAGGFGTSSVVGTGFSTYTALIGASDWNGDGHDDVIARGAGGGLYVFYGASNGTIVNGGQIGSGWGGFTSFIGAADRNSDAKADILVRSADSLLLYRGNGTGGFLTSITASASGWANMVMNEPTANGVAPTHPDDQVAKPGLGAQEFYAFEEFGLAENLSAAVNLANGNLVVRDTDVAVNGPGAGTRLDRFYNSLSTRGGGAYGQGWSISAGQDVGLEIFPTKVVFRGPSGFRAAFTPDGGGGWIAPSGLNADLTQSGSTWILEYRSNSQELTFTSGGYLTSQKDRNGVGITYAYNANNEVTSVTDAAGRVTTFTYTGGVLTKITDPASRETTFGYTSGRLTSSTDADNKTTQYRYDSNDRLDRIRTPRGSTTDIGYDSSGRVSTITKYTALNSTTGPQVTTFAYTPSGTGGTTVQTNPLSQGTTYTWDTSGRIIKVTDAMGRERSQTWTANSGIATTTDAMGSGGVGGNITTYSYDASNNPVQAQAPTGAAANAVYTSGGSCGSTDTAHPYQAKCSTDDAGGRTSFTYDTAGNTLKAQDTTPDSGGNATAGIQITKTYQGTSGATCGGKTGQICSETDGEGNLTSYTYDTDGNLATTTPPSPLGSTSYGYDSLGRLTSYTDGKGQTTTYGYDIRDHLTSTTVAGTGPGLTRTATFDADGNQTANDAETTSYDAQNRADAVFPPTETGTGWQLARDAAGRITTTTDSANRTTTYSYDASGLLTAIAEPGGNCPASGGAGTKCTRFTYDNNANQVTTTFPGATVETTTRDNSGRATRIRVLNSASTVLSDLAYSYTVSGGSGPTADRSRLQARTDHLGVGGPAGSVTRYTYDTLNRLLAATETTSGGSASAAWTYTYDDNGNRLSQVRTGNTGITAGTTSYTYNAADQLTAINGSSTGIAYDANGNQTALPGLVAAGVPAQSSTLNTGDQVASATVSGTTTTFAYNGNSNAHRTRSGGRDLTTSLLGLEHTGSDATNNARKYIKTPSGETIGTTATTANPNSLYFLRDNIGSVVGIVNASGTKTAAYAYDPYGITRTATGTAAAANPLRYTGAYQDSQTGLYKLGLRYYDPSTGRFTQQDPTGREANPYAYATSDPINNVDPSGADTLSLVLEFVGDVGFAVDIYQIIDAYQAGDYDEAADLFLELVGSGVVTALCIGVATGGASFTGGASLLILTTCAVAGEAAGRILKALADEEGE